MPVAQLARVAAQVAGLRRREFIADIYGAFQTFHDLESPSRYTRHLPPHLLLLRARRSPWKRTMFGTGEAGARSFRKTENASILPSICCGILEEADACTKSVELGALLHRLASVIEFDLPGGTVHRKQNVPQQQTDRNQRKGRTHPQHRPRSITSASTWTRH